MNKLFRWLKRPYPSPQNWKSDLGYAIGLSIFIFLFLRLFQPFGLHHQFSYKTLIIGGFGLVTLFSYGIVRFMLPFVFQKWFHSESWTTGKQLVASLANILLIGFGNFAYMAYLGYSPMSGKAVLFFLLYTALVAIFPVSVMIILTEMRLLKLHLAASSNVNQQIEKSAVEPVSELPIQLNNQDGKEILELIPSTILFCSAADNYVEIHFLQAEAPKKKLLRSSLKHIESQLSSFPKLVRCHRSHLVNLNHIAHADGNSAGLRLTIKQVDAVLPVSRSYVGPLRQRLEAEN